LGVTVSDNANANAKGSIGQHFEDLQIQQMQEQMGQMRQELECLKAVLGRGAGAGYRRADGTIVNQFNVVCEAVISTYGPIPADMALFDAVAVGNTVLAKSLMRTYSYDGNFLFQAISMGWGVVISILLEHDSRFIGASGVDGISLCSQAVNRGNAEILKILIESGANVNQKDSDGFTPLHYAADINGVCCAKILISNGCNLEIEDHSCETALIHAAYFGNIEVVKLLVQEGCVADHLEAIPYGAIAEEGVSDEDVSEEQDIMEKLIFMVSPAGSGRGLSVSDYKLYKLHNRLKLLLAKSKEFKVIKDDVMTVLLMEAKLRPKDAATSRSCEIAGKSCSYRVIPILTKEMWLYVVDFICAINLDGRGRIAYDNGSLISPVTVINPCMRANLFWRTGKKSWVLNHEDGDITAAHFGRAAPSESEPSGGGVSAVSQMFEPH
jgi:hypothetical protein